MRFCDRLILIFAVVGSFCPAIAPAGEPPDPIIVPLPPTEASPSPEFEPIQAVDFQQVPFQQAASGSPPSRVVPIAAAVEVAGPKPLESVPLESVPLAAESAEVAPPSIARGDDAYPIDLATAVHLAGGESLSAALAREQAREAAGRVRAAEVLWLPSVRLGLNYNKHEGVIQQVDGVPIRTSRGAFYNGLGAGAVGAGSPVYPGLSANFHLADALVQPAAARQTAAARRDAASAATNDALLDGALAYLDLLARAQELAIAAEAHARAERLAELTADFARSGNGTLADADRARVEVSLRAMDTARTRQAYEMARARLAQVLRLEPTLKLTPIEKYIRPLQLVDAELPAAEYVARGLATRPELAQHRHLVHAAVERLRRERLAPLVPSVLVGASYGGFGAGLGGTIGGYGDRFDFDAVAYWELRNLGYGEQAARSVAQSQVNQTRLQQLAVMDQVAREIVEAHAALIAGGEQVNAAREALGAAHDSYRRNVERIHGGEGLPIETLQALQAWVAAEREYARAVTDFNAAQFRLQRATGWAISLP